jgi:hypothetical protein
MERRTHIRKVIDSDLTVYLYFSGQRIGQCSAYNLSTGGVFLNTAEFDLPLDTPLDLLFTVDTSSSNVVRLHRISALVAHRIDTGVGMRFSGRDKHFPFNGRRQSQRANLND